MEERLVALMLDCMDEKEIEEIHDMGVGLARLIEGIHEMSGGGTLGMIPTVDDVIRASARAMDQINESLWEKRFENAPHLALMHYPVTEPEVRFLEVCPL